MYILYKWLKTRTDEFRRKEKKTESLRNLENLDNNRVGSTISPAGTLKHKKIISVMFVAGHFLSIVL